MKVAGDHSTKYSTLRARPKKKAKTNRPHQPKSSDSSSESVEPLNLQYVRKQVRKLPSIDESRNNVSGVIVLGPSTLDEFQKFQEANYRTIGCKLALQNGDVIIYEIPYTPHGQCQAEIIGQLRDSNRVVLNREFRVTGPTHVLVGANTCREPDLVMTAINRPRPQVRIGTPTGGAYPSLVVEIACSTSLGYLDSLAPIYFDDRTRIRLYLGIKLWERRNDGTAMMVAMLYSRGTPAPLSPTVISFGTANLAPATLAVLNNSVLPVALTGVGAGGPPCNAAGLPQYQLQLPTVELYNHVPGGVPAGYPPTIDIDLFEVQQEVMLGYDG